ncbi:zinc-binding dehydrogenase [Microvirga lotononidis]|uniref:enoyl-[acyl-carrier-protein] reductase n=1 Tax=Microvirga lotononidis TaxID=864069 RepID=I4YZQ5_9HYPH|nr:zinc-binding dehydrogenase [Microvirga lotononidis]EIM29447.1 Zn-dependent oxidoreductase, NADPH:quinone reductase [Microvirga lotononidis]WQO27234.1 zinc-binding dehydrogenase [Microvirga lotononidis]
MRSVVFERFGDPAQVLTLAERERPVPGPGQALVRMVLSPIHNHDLMTVAGTYGIKPPLPAIGGTEALGVVEELGDGVENLQVGQRVIGGGQQTWADHYLVDARRARPVPDGIDDETACQLIAMPLSAKMVLAALGLQRGDWLVQNSANGAVGRLLSRFGGEKGINVLGLVRRDAAVAELAAAGITNVVSTEQPGWEARARDLVGDGPISAGLDSVGGDGPAQLARLVADGGEIVIFGAMSGQPIRIDPSVMIFQQITIRGFWGAKPGLAPEVIGGLLEEVLAAAAGGTLTLPVDATFPLDQIADAVRASNEPGRKGKVVLRGR